MFQLSCKKTSVELNPVTGLNNQEFVHTYFVVICGTIFVHVPYQLQSVEWHLSLVLVLVLCYSLFYDFCIVVNMFILNLLASSQCFTILFFCSTLVQYMAFGIGCSLGSWQWQVCKYVLTSWLWMNFLGRCLQFFQLLRQTVDVLIISESGKWDSDIFFSCGMARADTSLSS